MAKAEKKSGTARPSLPSARRIVVKVGSALLVDQTHGTLRADWLDGLVADVARCVARGAEVIVVSSGAIALGRHALRRADRIAETSPGPLRLEESQAAAAIGQITLARAYAERLSRHGLPAAQILLTLGDTEERRRYLNARTTLATLLAAGAVPIVNENDTVATSEIRYGDNDRLAARVASMVSADMLVLLSDVDGLYTASPHDNPDARRLDVVREITPDIAAMAGEARSASSRGGMITKLEAARIATQAGAHMAIASGTVAHPLTVIEEDGPCTWFVAGQDPIAARKRWIAGSLSAGGALVIDDGAAHALTEGNSLLAAGIAEVEGDFSRGDAVTVRATSGAIVAHGLSAYDAVDVERIRGKKSDQIAEVLGFAGRRAVIHRDDLVLASRQREA
ncbi:MAG: glutamate 5-kinase [Pseudomonadota bacterium]